jgi:serine/threonine protein kinase
VLEFVDGMDLEKFVRSEGGKLDLAKAAPIMMGILAGLAHAHRARIKLEIAGGASMTFNGIVHRDLKPANILLARSAGRWIPKVADLGLAKSFESAGLTDMTAPRGLGGTPLYWPREQITHYRLLAPPSDVFSIAAVFYEMLTGTAARDSLLELFAECARRGSDPSFANVFCVIAEHPIAPLRSRNPSIPKRVADVIDRALREEEVPADEQKLRAALARLRYPDAGDFRDALEKAFKQEGITG